MADPGSRPASSPLAVLGNRNFALYWAGQLISLVGTWMQQLALSWAVLDLVPSALALGAVNFVAALPPVLLLLHGGVVADRGDKRRILIATQAVFMVGAFALAALVHWEGLRLWHVLSLSVVLGVGVAYDLPASQALVPELVERAQIPAAVQLLQAIFHGSRLLGPAVAGWLVGRYGSYSAFVVNGLSFLPVILTLIVIRPQRRVPAAGLGGRAALGEGLAYVRARPQILALLGLTGLTALLIFPNMVVLMPYYTKQVLGLGAGALGTLMTASGAGALLGTGALLTVPEQHRLGRIRRGLVGAGLGLAALVAGARLAASAGAESAGLPLALWVGAAGAFILSGSVSTVMGLVATILQQTVDDQVRGRVMSLHSLVFMAVLPVASLAVTGLVDRVGMAAELLAASLAYAALGLLLAHRLRAPAPVAGQPA